MYLEHLAMFRNVLAFTGFLFWSFSASAAIVTLNYSGNAFDPTATIDEAIPTGIYSAANSVTGFFTVDDTVLATGFVSDVDILSWSFMDGRQTLSSANGDSLWQAQVSYNVGTGTVTDWKFITQSPGEVTELGVGEQWGEIITNTMSSVPGDGARIIECISDCLPFTQDTVYGGDRGSTGTAGGVGAWEVAAVPIPAAAWLFGSALLTLAGIKRRKAAA